MFKKPLEGPRFGIYWHVLQTHAAAEIGFNRFVKLFPKESWSSLWSKRPNESEKTVFLTGHREVSFKSGQNFEDLRGETLHGGIIDECRQQNQELWTGVMRPMLSRYNGWCDFYSTPHGYDWFYDLRNFALENPEEWGVVHSPSWGAWWWTKAEIESARQSMSQALFDQEIGAEFRDIYQGKAYINFSQENLVSKSPFNGDKDTRLFNPYLPIILGADFNVHPMVWEIGQNKYKQWYWFDEVALEDSNTPEASEAFCQRVLKMKAEGLRANPNVIIVGDASGKARSTTSAGQTDYTILEATLKKHGISFENRTPDSNPFVKDRVNTFNHCLKTPEGEINMWVHPTNCPRLKKDGERVAWKDAKGAVLDKTSDKSLTHASDAAGYPLCVLSPLTPIGNVGTLKVITRW